MRFDKTIVIVGATGSGKTGVAIELAKSLLSSRTASSAVCGTRSPYNEYGSLAVRTASSHCIEDGVALGREDYGGEIIAADSRTIYRGMDIGTAKPDMVERAGVPHWGFDLVDSGERFTVADWKKYAEEKIAEIRGRGKLPIIVGGTGLYVDALIYDYRFTEEAKRSQDDRQEVSEEYLVIGVKTETDELRKRLIKRIDQMFTQELFEETERLVGKYGWGSQAMKSDIYQFAWGYLQGEYSLEKAKELAFYDDWHLAKRQMTWFKRNKGIRWLPLAEIKDFVVKYVQDEQRRKRFD